MMKTDLDHTMRAVIFAGVAVILSTILYLLFFRDNNLLVELSSGSKLEFDGLSQLALTAMLIFDMQIVMYELLKGSRRK